MHFAALAIIVPLLAGCSRSETSESTSDALSETIEVFSESVYPIKVPDKLIQALEKHASNTATQFVKETQEFSKLTKTFLQSPTDQHHHDLQAQWLRTHIAFTNAQLGLITNNDPKIKGVQSRIETWPIQPGFIDNLPDYPYSGVVFDETVPITKETILLQHGFTDDEEVLLGLHSLELLVFSRDITDFQVGINQWNNRRRTLLSMVTDQFLQDAISFEGAVKDFYAQGLTNERTITLFLEETLAKTRIASTESHLFAAQDTGHCLTADRSLAVLTAEIDAMNQFLIAAVPLDSVLSQASPTAFKNFTITIENTQQALSVANDNEVSRANLPLLLSALTHQIESFHQAFRPISAR